MRVKSISTRRIQGPVTNSASTSTRSFGMKLNVASLIWVAACSMPMSSPVTSAVSSKRRRNHGGHGERRVRQIHDVLGRHR